MAIQQSLKQKILIGIVFILSINSYYCKCFESETIKRTKAQIIETDYYCDIIVAGGSTSALATALASARDSPTAIVCLIEPTDWAGGQLTASAVSAIDFGNYNQYPINQPFDFAEMMATIPGNPGACWVSIKCYEPKFLLDNWINPTISSFSNLKVFYMSVFHQVLTNNRIIQSVKIIQRNYISNDNAWNKTFSRDVNDWYSINSSSIYQKTIYNLKPFPNKQLIIIDATEFGDILVLSDASFAQGIESPDETSWTTIETCGQQFTYPFYMRVESNPTKEITYGLPLLANYDLEGYSWGMVWSYRRSLAESQANDASIGEISNQNWGSGNDYGASYLLLPVSEAKNQVTQNNWQGGLDLISLNLAENFAFGWFTWFRNQTNNQTLTNLLTLAKQDVVGTQTGISKMPYIRDTRRSIGIQDFRLQYNDLIYGDGPTGYQFEDTVALGDYFYADTHRMQVKHCDYPDYMNNTTLKPFYIPYRALTNRDFDNLLVAGKTIAQTFHANSATRLHPVEWSTGVAAGCSASLIFQLSQKSQMNITTIQIYENYINQLQYIITKYAPIQWTF
eukprot:TRINITY_DN3072_c0_g1_i1.p1 TRINITY_DN3072_c0_g1~~TRINITY_DN3072_c0_g1_i1.p1  ORF type:complete len:578 (+),score=262.15 TRINITY_DN3072_c0_g1_i1:41-1735(+)